MSLKPIYWVAQGYRDVLSSESPRDLWHIQVIQILWTRADPLAASYVHPLFPAQVACPRGVAHAEHARWSGSFSL